MKKFLIVAISLLCIICAGCFEVNSELTITDTGAVIGHYKFIGTAALTQPIEDWKNQAKKLNPNIKIKAIEQGDLRGYELVTEYPDIETFAKSASKLYLAHEGKNKGISRRKSWFFDEYDFDFYWTSSSAQTAFNATVNQALLSRAVLDATINLPYAVDTTNADEVSDGGKFLKWHLAHVAINGGEKFMQARFKIWHKDKVFLTATVELMLFAAMIFFLIKARSEDSETLGKDFRFKRNVFAGLFVALSLIAAYFLFTPIAFTDADIISVATQS